VAYRLFCCSDTHGRLPDLPAGPFDATLHAGDVYKGAELSRRGRDESPMRLPGWVDPDTAAVERWIETAGPVCVVRGNHDLADPHEFFRRSDDVTGRVIRVGDGLLIAGLGWHGERYYELPGESEMSAVCESVRRQLRRLCSSRDSVVLVTHYPPKLPEIFPHRVPETGWWHACTRALVDEITPALVVQGHIHELAGEIAEVQTPAGATLVVSPGKRGMVLTIDPAERAARVERVL
jgi:Icc-related predicted phosphoesterase